MQDYYTLTFVIAVIGAASGLTALVLHLVDIWQKFKHRDRVIIRAFGVFEISGGKEFPCFAFTFAIENRSKRKVTFLDSPTVLVSNVRLKERHYTLDLEPSKTPFDYSALPNDFLEVLLLSSDFGLQIEAGEIPDLRECSDSTLFHLKVKTTEGTSEATAKGFTILSNKQLKALEGPKSKFSD